MEDLNHEVIEGRTSGGGSSVAVLLRAAFRAHIVWVSDFRYDVLMCFGLSLRKALSQNVFAHSSWYALCWYMK